MGGRVGLGVAPGGEVGLAVGVAACGGVGEKVGVLVGPGAGVGEGERVPVGVAVAVAVGVPVPTGVAEGVFVRNGGSVGGYGVGAGMEVLVACRGTRKSVTPVSGAQGTVGSAPGSQGSGTPAQRTDWAAAGSSAFPQTIASGSPKTASTTSQRRVIRGVRLPRAAVRPTHGRKVSRQAIGPGTP